LCFGARKLPDTRKPPTLEIGSWRKCIGKREKGTKRGNGRIPAVLRVKRTSTSIAEPNIRIWWGRRIKGLTKSIHDKVVETKSA